MELTLQVYAKKLIMINSVNGLKITKVVNLPMRNFSLHSGFGITMRSYLHDTNRGYKLMV